NRGVFTGTGGALTTIAKAGDAAPGGIFADFTQGMVGISAGGTAFQSTLTDGSLEIVNASGGTLTKIVKTGDAAPVGTFTSLSSFSTGDTAVAFLAVYGSGSGIFRSSGGSPVAIVKTGDAAPSGTFTSLGTPSIAGSKEAFFANYLDATHGGIF